MYGAAFKNLNQPSHVNCSQCADSRTSETATLPAAPANAIATSSFAPSIRARSKCLVFALYSSFEALSGVELELRKLEGSVEAIHENLIYLKGREAEMRTVSETTNARVAWFSIMSLGICIAVSVLQLCHLKRYFQKKKLI
ncbi:transmembrane emp24 domain-containing protein p24delta3-like [Trifolium pratense]|uniref:Transmembrane emp24 domain-containing protein p24delta3-like n=1 Tax=Trifolium pratense TaxID=57577 RepID=A0A2K3N973_TRIPR|nr:transmembrane emp24 domain-containing protein p24delta3-like [Trifolium pratense]